MRLAALILVSVLALGLSGARAAGLPDTGQDLCDNGSNVLVACTSANTRDAATYPRQDGRFGRDAKATAGTLAKTGGGAAGFDYTKVANDGSDLAAGASLGSAATDWACTRDNITGLVWEVKTATNTDLRYSGHTYAWYSTNAATNGGNAGTNNPVGDTCNGTLFLDLCNTEAFVAAVNTAALCDYADWRMPTQRELLTLVHAGTSVPSIDSTYFPNTIASGFWSGSSYVPPPARAWVVNFGNGNTNADFKSVGVLYVRLVRGGQF